MRRWAGALLAAAVFVAALAPRASTWQSTFARPVVLLEEVDAYYHLRRIELALANDLVPPAVDTYNNHPVGARVDWPPGFDISFALTWHLLSKLTPLEVSPAAVGAVGVAVLGSLAAATAAVLAARWGLAAALAAGLSVAFSPAAVAYSRVGRLDHHAVEPLCLLVLAWVYAWFRKRTSTAGAAVLGAVVALSTFFWVGAAFYAATLALAFALEARLVDAPLARRGAVAYLVAAGTAGLLALSSPWGRDLEAVYYALSWFQPLIFLALGLAFAVVMWLEGRGVEGRRAWAVGAATLAVSGGLVLLPAGESVGRGLDFLLGSDPVAATILESRSLVETGFAYALSWLTPVALALPALWIATVVIAFRRKLLDPLLAAALALGLLAAPFTLLQMRFGPHAAVVAGLLAAWLVGRAARPLVAGGAVAVLAASLAWGVRPATLPDSAVHPYLLGGFDALTWLRTAPPRTSHVYQPWKRPEYGVAAEWTWGHWITQIGQKPNVANPLGQTPANLRGVEEVARLLLAESGSEALARARRLDVRYLLLSPIPVTVSELAAQAGRDPLRYVTRHPEGSDDFHPPFFETFHSRLYLGGGAAPVAGVRLVFESRVRIDFLGSRPAVRIFEVVPGASLTGTCEADLVEVRADLEGRELVYTAREVPGPDGRWALELPYASEPAEASIPARITVRCGEEEVPVEVSERDVLEGREVAVPGGRRNGRQRRGTSAREGPGGRGSARGSLRHGQRRPSTVPPTTRGSP